MPDRNALAAQERDYTLNPMLTPCGSERAQTALYTLVKFPARSAACIVRFNDGLQRDAEKTSDAVFIMTLSRCLDAAFAEE